MRITLSTIRWARPTAALRGPLCGANGWTPPAAPAVVYRGLLLAHVNVARRDADVDRPARVTAERPRGAGADHARTIDRDRPAVDRDIANTGTRIQVGVRLGRQPQIDIAGAHVDIHRGAGGQRAFQRHVAGRGAQPRAVGEGRVADGDV